MAKHRHGESGVAIVACAAAYGVAAATAKNQANVSATKQRRHRLQNIGGMAAQHLAKS
jgi:hypothetical protein